MSLEEVLKENTAALIANTKSNEAVLAMRVQMLEAVGAEDEKSVKKPAEKKPAAKKTATKKSEDTGNISKTPEDRKDLEASDGDEMSPREALEASIKSFMGIDDDKERRGERAKLVKKIFANPKINAETAKDVPEKMINTVIANLTKKAKELKAEYAEADASGEDDDLLG